MSISAQDVFNAGWKHFVIEGNPPSVGENGRCRYRGFNQTKCLVGLVIPDDIAMESEGKNVHWIDANFKGTFVPDDLDLICDLQLSLHDHLCTKDGWLVSPEELKQRYVCSAEHKNLTIPE